ncbi:Protein FAM110C [Oryzias melastigma]|uniref:Protein FAM110C n=1 Tax=Oryzias melastigma TaxID=30732 RepID=A0A834FNN6_ORYME|nr:Protein FAM110C [Oryzias melastigma]
METNSDATKILEKGPEYLRKQMERDNKGHMSAVERLAASKPKYVKSQQVVNSCQEPVIGLSLFSGSSTESSNLPLNHGGNLVTRSSPAGVAQDSSPGKERQSSSKKRPDSLLIYRQKCESLRGPANNHKHPMSRKLLLGSVNRNVPLLGNAGKECGSEGNKEKRAAENCSSVSQSEKRSNRAVEETSTDSGTKKAAGGLLEVPQIERRSGKGVSRSHSDISSRYSRNFADFDVFFKYCGLDGDIIDSLGRENFSTCSEEISMTIVRSVSVSTSDDGFSRDSGDSDGLLGKELVKKEKQGTSVIERNARIIKWLYSCKNAAETGKKLRDLS